MTKSIRVAAWMVLVAAGMAAGPATKPAGLAGESHQIASVAKEDLLRPRDASNKEGAPIVLYPKQDWKCMTWKFEPAGDGVRLMNYFTHKTLYPSGTQDGAPVAQHAAGKDVAEVERWRFVPVGENVYRIEHVGTGKALTVTSNGHVVVDPWTDGAGQKWKLLEKPEKFTG